MNFYDLATIPKQNVFREAKVSATRGDRILKALVQDGRVSPVRTPTNREFLTPPDGEVIFNALVNG